MGIFSTPIEATPIKLKNIMSVYYIMVETPTYPSNYEVHLNLYILNSALNVMNLRFFSFIGRAHFLDLRFDVRRLKRELEIFYFTGIVGRVIFDSRTSIFELSLEHSFLVIPIAHQVQCSCSHVLFKFFNPGSS